MRGCALRLVKASTQCARASTPVAAATGGGTVRVRSGSTTARSASMCRLCTASLFCVAGSVTSARVPASLPVPDVVGTWISATRRPFTFSEPTTSWMVCSLPGRTATSLAKSIALPPPKPTTRSGCRRSASATAWSKLGISGSGFTSPKTVTSPGRPRTSTRAALKASATTRTRRMRFSFAQRPTVATAPGPNSIASGRTISIGESSVFIDDPSRSGGCPRRPVGGQQFGVFDRLDEAALVGDALAGDVEGGAVIDRGADDRQAEGDVDARKVFPLARLRIDLEAEQLHRDVPLVVVHGDHCVVLAGAQLDEDRIARDRTHHVQPVRDRLGDGR